MNFAIIGCGRIAPRHAQAMQTLHNAKIVAVCDKVETRAVEYSKKFGGDVYTDFRKVLDRKDVDIVTLCVPSGLHSELGQEAAIAGKHVLVEKPISLTLEQADKLINTCKENRVTLGVVLQNRFNPPIQELRQLVDSGGLGKLLLGNATVRWYRPQRYYEDEWHGTWSMDGGAFMNQCIHHIDALQWFMGDVESVFSYTGTLVHKMEAEDTGVAVIKFKNGGIGVVEGSTITYPENIEGSLSIFGEKGSIKIGGTALNRKVFWKVEGKLEQESEMLSRETMDPPSVYGQSHREQIAEMISAIEENRPPKTSGSEARKSLRLVLAFYESARSGKEVYLNKLDKEENLLETFSPSKLSVNHW